MQNIRFHNSTRIDENIKKKQLSQTQYPDSKIVVDINKLLNRVKIEKKNETQKKIIFFSSVVLALVLIGTFLATIK
tara:strand:+ start:282 stop:509 length:228 start_codon:yes stop_codon:yes gene_type:complete